MTTPTPHYNVGDTVYWHRYSSEIYKAIVIDNSPDFNPQDMCTIDVEGWNEGHDGACNYKGAIKSRYRVRFAELCPSFERGDLVRVAKIYERGSDKNFDAGWTGSMEAKVGKELKVQLDHGLRGVSLEDGYMYPRGVLDLVKRAKPKDIVGTADTHSLMILFDLKPGDRVRIARAPNPSEMQKGFLFTSHMYDYIGKEFDVIGVDGSDHTVSLSGGGGWTWPGCVLERVVVTPEPLLRKFETGDRVKAIKACDGKTPTGIGTVRTADRHMVEVTWDTWCDGHGRGGHNWNYDTDRSLEHLRVVNIAATPEDLVFKVGDRGVTRGGVSYEVVKRHDMGVLDVVLDGKLETSHCYTNGRCFCDGREVAGDLMPPTETQKVDDLVKIEARIKPTPRFNAGDCGKTRDGRDYLVTGTNEYGLLAVEIDGVRHPNHAYAESGRCMPPQDHPQDLLPPTHHKPLLAGLAIHRVIEDTLARKTSVRSDIIKKESPMRLNIENRTYVNGNNARDINDEGLIQLIGDTEAEIARLQKIQTKSAKIQAQIKSLQTGAERLASILDERTAPAA